MNKITPLALLVTGGLAAPAAASTIVTFNLSPSTEGAPVFIGGASAPQYVYATQVKQVPGGPTFPVRRLNGTQSTSYFTTLANASDLPSHSNSFYQGSFKVENPGSFVGLKFNIGDDTYFGTARFITSANGGVDFIEDLDGPRLGEIEYELAGAVPEAETWALLIAGFGATGAVLRRRRRSTLVTA